MKILIKNNEILKLNKTALDLLNSEYSSEFSKALVRQHNAQVIEIDQVGYDCMLEMKFSDLVLDEFGVYKLDDYNALLVKCELRKEMQEIDKWFVSTDYIPMKIVRENWLRTDERYIAYANEYNIKHARKEEILALLEV